MKILNHSHSGFIAKTQTDTTSGVKQDVYRFCINDERINRNGWKTITAGIDFSAYLSNPVVLLFHDDSEFPVGKAINVFADQEKLYADIVFHEQDDESILTKKLVDLGVMTRTSIGIKPTAESTPIPIPPEDRMKYPFWRDVIDVFTQSELREISMVTIPANDGAGLIEKLTSAFNDGILQSSDKATLSKIISINENDTRRINQQFSKENSMKTLEEANAEIGRLQTNIGTIGAEKTALQTLADKLQSDVTNLSAELESTKSQLTAKEAELVQKNQIYDELAKQHDEGKLKLIEAQVDADIASLSDKILPAENNEQNQFKLRRDLLHLKSKAETLVDVDGKPLYDAKIAEIQSRKSLNSLTKPLGTSNLSADEDYLSYSSLDLDKPDEAERWSNYVQAYAEKNKLEYEAAHKILITKTGGK